MSLLNTYKMIYRNLGNSGLKISVISFGNMINYKPQTYKEDLSIISTALANGVNYFDTAQSYVEGQAEQQLGKILKELKVNRQQIVVSTKIRTAKEADINSKNTIHRKHIKESISKSLERLQLDYVDVIYAHFYDSATPLEQICRGFHEIIQEGKAFYWATSNWDADDVFNAFSICETLNLHKPIGGQIQYNMMVRTECQIQYQSLFKKYNYGLVAWSPLAGGILTGKYLQGIPENGITRLNDNNSSFSLQVMKDFYLDPHANEKNNQKLKDLSQFATKQFQCKLTHLAIAWAIKYQYISSALIGARTAEQLQDSLKAIQVLSKITPELQDKINKVLNNTPKARFNFAIAKDFPNARQHVK